MSMALSAAAVEAGVIEAVASGRDAVVLMPTGGGNFLVRGDEAAERGEALREGAHDEVYVVRDAVVVADAAAAFAEDADGVGLVDHDSGVVFLGKLDDAREIGHVAFHREHAVGHDELDFVGSALAKLRLKALHIVVLVFERLRERQPTPLDNRCVVLFVPDDIVFAAGQTRHYAEVHAEPRRVNHHIFLAYILGDARLELLVEVERAVEEGRAGAAGAILAGGLDGRFFDAGVVDKTGVAVRTEHEHALAVDNHFRILLRGNGAEIRIDTCRFGLLGSGILGELFLKELHIIV
jgi:hypothetical protein